MDRPLSDLLVLETASVLAGPAAGMFFAELGARVIKIENPRTGGDVTRKWKLPEEDPASPISAYFSSVNWGKEHLMLDLQAEDDRRRFDELVRSADVLISNHMPADAEKLGLTRERLHALNPRLVHGHVKGFAHDADRPAYDAVLQAETGYISMTGTEATAAKVPIALIDVLSAHQLKEGLLVALLQRQRTDEGAYVEASLEEAALAGLVNQASNYLMTGAVARPMGTLHPNIAPYGELFSCSDGGRIILAVGSDRQFAQLCRLLSVDALAADERYATNAVRVANRGSLAAAFSDAIGARKRDDLLADLAAVGIPAGAVLHLDEVLATPAARSMVLESMIDGMRTLRIRGNAFRIAPGDQP